MALAIAAGSSSASEPEPKWRALQAGVEYVLIEDHLHIVRIDPSRATLVAAMAKARDRQARTAGEWCRGRELAVAINLGMYATDLLTNVGHAHIPGHVNNARWSSSYKSALVFEPKKKGLPAALLLDLDDPVSKQQLAQYSAAIQNLRLIRAPGENVWSKQDRRWTEAAVAMDKQGRLLFIFAGRPYSMHELNAKLLALPLAITNAMHVEGGPEASLSIHTGGLDLDLSGNYLTGSGDGETGQWPIPNVLGVARK